jgi:hypothetical protein
MDANGSNLRRLIQDMPAEFARWSPDGRRLAFISGDFPDTHIYVAGLKERLNVEGINWRRVFVCGSGAGLAWSLLSLPLLILAGGEIIDAVPRPLVTIGRIGSFTLNVVAGIWAVWLYAAIRPRYGAGPKTAAIAGFSWWLIATIATWQWADLGFIRFRDLVGPMVASLPTLIAVTMVGAWSYQGKDAPKASANTAHTPGA